MQGPQKAAVQPLKGEVIPFYRNNAYRVIVSSLKILTSPAPVLSEGSTTTDILHFVKRVILTQNHRKFA